MMVLSWDEREKSSSVPKKASVGVFDGLHLGHANLLQKIVCDDFQPTVFTFARNPKKITKSMFSYDNIFTLEQRLEFLENSGVGLCVLIDFSDNFSKLSGEQFVSILVRSFNVLSFVIGSDFSCGHKLTTKANDFSSIAASLGAVVEIVPPLLFSGEPVSSSRIRSAIENGQLELASDMLGRPYTLDIRSIDASCDIDSTYVLLYGRHVVVPMAGYYNTEFIYHNKKCDVMVEVSKHGLVKWPLTYAKPDFIIFKHKIDYRGDN